ncbi:uncharacterized protein [Euwallacea fornicatus]|uniref:uncharacterized protein n=1 Tax=Euwallacea fornicatus TaxID=995702 RepID=UPI00338D8AC3
MHRKLQTNLHQLNVIKKLLRLKLENIEGLNRETSNVESRISWENVVSCFNQNVTSNVIINLTHKDINQFLNDSSLLFETKIKEFLKQNPVIKVASTFCGEFIKKSGDKEIINIFYFNTNYAIIDVGTNLLGWFRENIQDQVLNQLSEFQERDSGFALQKIDYLEININKFEMGSGSTFIKLPKEISKKRACINIQNDDQACFYWSIVSAIYPVINNNNRITSYPHYSAVLNTTNLEMPMPLNKIYKFEKLNDISVNVYALEMSTVPTTFYAVVPVRLTPQKLNKHINLLLIQNKYYPKLNDYNPVPTDAVVEEEDTNIIYHYCWIKDLSRLLSSQLNKHKQRKFICDRCLNYFSNHQKLLTHEVLCTKLNDCHISFPKYDFIEFKNHVYQQKAPFVIYADFESQLENVSFSNDLGKYQRHIPFSVGYFIKCAYNDSLSQFKMFRGTNCVEWFVNEMIELSKFIYNETKKNTPMNIQLDLSMAKRCHICEKPFSPKDEIIRDHDHFTGIFRGFAHSVCNLNFRKQFVVPIIFQNLSGYDSHFLIKLLCKKGCLSVLPINKEKYISFTHHVTENDIKFRYIDSYRFLGASLDELAKSMQPENLKLLKSQFLDVTEEKFKLLTCKGVFCYDYIDSIDKLDEKTLPSKEYFYNKLEDSHIDDEKYSHASKVWDSFNIQTLGEYSDLYLKTDVILLADIFEHFKLNCISTHNLDPSWYFTMPGYTWDCMLKYTKCKLELLHDIDQIMFIEKGIRGSVSVCSSRYSEANNKYMFDYDPVKPSKYLLYLDVNNLYGKAMCEPLPYGGFEWIEDTNFDVLTIPDDSPVGYILQVDLQYPNKLHDTHKDFPFAPEHLKPPQSKLPKLMTTLFHKQNYIVHYRNLKQMLKHGLVSTKIHKILKFNQSPWLKSYIELNNGFRTQAQSTFEKNLFKLFNNAVFGKTMENIRKHRAVKIVKSWEGRYGAKNFISSPRFHSRLILDENLVIIELKKSSICFNKPQYIGMAILDLSKIYMYDFHYEYMLPKMGVDRCKLMYMDTDSFIYELCCNDVYEEIIKRDLTKFDTSDYPTNNPYNIPPTNKKVLGLMKDEANGKIISHFVGLRSKMYSFKIQDGKVTKKAKGVKHTIVRNKLTFNDYVECLKNFKITSVTQRSIRSYNHEIYSVEQNKIALNPYDDKRQILSNSFDTLPYGHYSLSNIRHGQP